MVGSRCSAPVRRCLTGFDGSGLFFESTADFYGAVVPQKTADFPCNFRDSIGGEHGTELQVKSLYGLQKTDAAKLIEVVRVDTPIQNSGALQTR